MDDDLDLDRTETQKEWNTWARHGYRKMYTPRSILWAGLLASAGLAVALVVFMWLVATGRI